MDEVILRHLTGETTDVEARRLEKWREASPANEIRFHEVQVLWEGLEAARGRPGDRRPDVTGMLDEAERRRARTRARGSRKALLRSPWSGYGLALAATVALAFVGARVWMGGTGPGASLSAVESSLGSGEVVAMTLSDGSFVRAVAGTRLEFPSEAGRREVLMDGQAFFAVAEGPDPFVVQTAAGEVSVRGTRFEVRTDGDLLRVVVAEGVVGIAARGGNAEVRGGQVATVRGREAPEVVTAEDLWSLLEWPGGLLAFQQTPLADVAAQLGHHFSLDVRVEDPAAASLRVTGSFRDESLEDVVAAICAVTGIRCEQGDGVVVLGAGPRSGEEG